MRGSPDDPLFASPAADNQHLVRFGKRLTVQRRVRLVRRALAMGPQGWIDRGRSRWPGTRPTPPSLPGAPVNLAELRSGFAAGGLILPGTGRASSAWLTPAAHGEAEALKSAADALVRYGVTIYGVRVPLGDGALDWTADPATAQRCWPDTALDEQAAIDGAAAAARPVDVKRVWELGRQQFLAPLALATHLTGDDHYAQLAVACLTSWLDQCAGGRGIQWASPLEVALRAIAWCWTVPWLLDHRALPADTAQRWAESLAVHYETLRARLSVQTDPTNHLIGEAVGLWMVAVLWPTLPHAAAERVRTEALLAHEVARQVTADGVSEEQASGYHMFVLEFLLQMVALARRSGSVLPAIIPARTAAMVGVLDALLGHGGEVPQLGDWDDGRAMPCFGDESWRARAEGLVALGAHLLGVPIRGHRPACPGLVGLVAGASSPRTPARASGSQCFADGGLAIAECEGASGSRLQLVMRVGGFGALQNAGHAHADVLSFVLKLNGQTLLGDPGSGSYTGDRRVRETFRATRLHNTLTIDGLSQADPLDVFKWVNLPAVRHQVWASNEQFVWVGASHDGYTRLRDPVWHRRDVIVAGLDYLLAIDRLYGAGAHDVVRHFIVPPAVRVTADEQDGAVLQAAGGVGLALVGLPSRAVAGVAARTAAVPWSEGYGRWVPTSAIELSCRAALPVTLVTLLLPVMPLRPGVQLERAELVSDPAAAEDAWRLALRIGSAVRTDEIRVRRTMRPDEPVPGGVLHWQRGASAEGAAIHAIDGVVA